MTSTTPESRRRTVTALACVASLLVLAAGCGGGDQGADPVSAEETTADPTPSGETNESSPSPTASAGSPSAEPADGPPFPSDTASQLADPEGGGDLVLVDVRVAAHDGFDRVVLDFEGSGSPGWSVGYVDDPVLDGSGDPIRVAGQAYLDVYASGTTYPADGVYDGPKRVEGDGGDVAEVFVGGTFEGLTQVVVGLDGDQVPFRVFALTEPSRLVVDVAD